MTLRSCADHFAIFTCIVAKLNSYWISNVLRFQCILLSNP
jgi:hypothetical protein